MTFIGAALERIGEPDDPVEGSNVTLICITVTNYNDPQPMQWHWNYYENDYRYDSQSSKGGDRVLISHTNEIQTLTKRPNEGLYLLYQ